MAEPTSADKRRLAALQERLDASRDDKRAWTEERKELRARATAAERATKRLERVEEKLAATEADLAAAHTERAEHAGARADLDKRLGRVGEQQADLIGQNREQAEQLASLREENDILSKAATDAAQAQAAAQAQLKDAVAGQADLARRVQALEAENALSAEALMVARSQLKSEARPQVLPAEEVGGLIQRLMGQLRGSLPGLDVRDGEVKLRMAFATTGEVNGFVVPSADAREEITGPLHEVAFRFDRLADT